MSVEIFDVVSWELNRLSDNPKYLEVMKGKYPNTEFVVKSVGQLVTPECCVWACDCGCGEIKPVKTPVATRLHALHGELQYVEIQEVWTSPCVKRSDDGEHWGAFLWDDSNDTEYEPYTDLEDIK